MFAPPYLRKVNDSMEISFTKMQAYGNDYIYVNAIAQEIPDPGALSKEISRRHFGVGADGLVLVCPSDKADFRMRIFNPDGTEAEMCGNAIRSVAKYVFHYGLTKKTEFKIETLGGIKDMKLIVENGEVVNIHGQIGAPEFAAEKIPVLTEHPEFLNQPLQILDKEFFASCVSWGNPHTVIFVEDTESFDVHKYGPAVENCPVFPCRTNVTFAQVLDRKHIRIREWERGTGETLGCGTGCCTALVVAHRLGLCDREAVVLQPGGPLQVKWDDQGFVHMIGPSHIVYQGVYTYDSGKAAF